MNQAGPRNIGIGSLLRYRFPITAIASILHRIAGVVVFIYIPFMLWVFNDSLTSQIEYQKIHSILFSGVGSAFFWIFLAALSYHIIAGLKHLLADTGFAESMLGGIIMSWVTLVIWVVVIALLGVWIWI